MPLINDRAVCVRRHEFSETSQILSLLTERHGLIRVIARGSHRTTKAGASRFDGGIDLLDEGDALFTDRVEKDLNTLAEWKLIDGHRGVRASQRAVYLSLHLCELVGNLFEAHDPHAGLLDRFRRTLRALATPSLEEAALAMVVGLVAEAGLEPFLSACVACGASIAHARQLWFSPERGGVICRACEASTRDRLWVDPRSIAIASFLQRLPDDAKPPRLTRRQCDPIHVLLARHLEANVGRPMRTLRWIADPRRGVAVASPAIVTGSPPRQTGEPLDVILTEPRRLNDLATTERATFAASPDPSQAQDDSLERSDVPLAPPNAASSSEPVLVDAIWSADLVALDSAAR